MKLTTVKELLNAEVVCGAEHMDSHVYSACGSDMMSDVLRYVKDQAVLLTGLVNAQTIRTAEMMDMVCLVFVRDKKPTPEMIELADASGLVVMTTPMRMFPACGTLYAHGLNGGDHSDV